MARTPENRCVPVAEWPDADRLAWLRCQEPLDLLNPAIGQASRWSAATRTMIESSYGRWLGWLDLTGQLLGHEGPAERAQPGRLRAYHEALAAQGLADYTISGRIQQLGDGLKVLAPEHDFSWVSRAGWRLHARAKPSRDLRPRLRSADEVLQLAYDLMHAAEFDRFRTPIERACLFRDGLLIAFLVFRPLRRKNLASLELGKHVVQAGSDWLLHVPNDEGKSGIGLEVSWPTPLVEKLEHYLNVRRPTLRNCVRQGRQAQAELWVSKQGTAMSDDALWHQVRQRTRDEFGEAINLHSFRHIAATLIATEDPENAAFIAMILQHADLDASEKHYNRGRTIDAGKRYHAAMGAARKAARR